MAKMGKYGLGFKWAPEFPWMLPNASEKLGNPERSEEDGFCPSAAQEPKVKGKTLVNHVRVDCSRLPALECCVQSAIIRDIFVDEDPQKVEASTMMALQFGSAVLVKPSKRLSVQAWAKLGVLPKTPAMGLFKRFCLCNTRECVCDAHVAFQLFTVQPDGVCLGNGRFIGWFVPVTAIPEYAKQWLQPWSILLRKGGNKGSVTSGHSRRAVTMPVYDFNATDVVYADENQDDDADDPVVLVADTQEEDGVAKEQVDSADSEICVAHTVGQEMTEPDAVGSQTPIASAEETEVGEACDREGIAEVKATVCADALDACPDQVEAFDIEKVEDSILSELQTELNAPADKTYEDVLAFDAIYSETLSAFYAVPSDETHFKVCGFYSPAIERTNCWLRSTLIVMQSLPLEFKDLGMQKLWLSYKAGYDQCFVDKLVKSAPKSIILPQGGYVADFAYFFLSQCSFKVHANWRCLKCGMELKLQGLDAVFFYGDVVSHMCKCSFKAYF
nr:RecName: Full=Replicase polyprotein 1ab; Short=pp1ab; AltName: Full=ORF1ab polyprotein; Contains: RecName: Full=Non-structural protein 1-non-structural protein 3 fusion; Short=nsp1-nsp3 fusion [Murine hepatitis virus strain defective JHM]AAA46451.1 defective-interfering protein [Murine hepatitis virus]